MSTLSIIIPAYNEEETICLILDKIYSVDLLCGIEKEVIIVDDFSTDSTPKKIRDYKKNNPKHNIIIHTQQKNEGKGFAIRTGILISSGDYIIVQDADLEYDPNDYNDLLAPIVNGYADVVYGSRFIGGKPHRILFFWHTIGNKFLTLLSNMFTNLNLTDMEVGYKLMKSEVAKSLTLKEKRFGFEPEITAKLSKISNIRIYEVGISYYGRTYKEGKKIGWKDGFRAIYCIMKYNLFSK